MTVVWAWNPWHRKPQTAFEHLYHKLRGVLPTARSSRSRQGDNAQYDPRLAALLIFEGSALYFRGSTDADRRCGLLACLSGTLIQLGAKGSHGGLAALDELFRSISDLDQGHVDRTLAPMGITGKPWRVIDFEDRALKAAELLRRSGLSQKAADQVVFEALKVPALELKREWSAHTMRNLRADRKLVPVCPITEAQSLVRGVVLEMAALAAVDPRSVGKSRLQKSEAIARRRAEAEAAEILEDIKNCTLSRPGVDD